MKSQKTDNHNGKKIQWKTQWTFKQQKTSIQNKTKNLPWNTDSHSNIERIKKTSENELSTITTTKNNSGNSGGNSHFCLNQKNQRNDDGEL